jgi:RHS repeat-associated protein
VLVTISDKKLGVDNNSDGIIDYYNADVKSAQDFYPFGSKMPGRIFQATTYRYGFNGKEEDDEVKGDGNQIDYGMRVYDTRIGRFLSVDPLSDKYPWYTPYQFAGNKPIWCLDLDGLEDIPTNGGNYYSVQSLIDAAFKDIRVSEAIKRGERVELHQTYSVGTGNGRNFIDRRVVLSPGAVGANIAELRQDGNFGGENGVPGTGLEQTFNPSIGLFKSTPPAPEPPIQPQAPPNPPVSDGGTPTSPKPAQKRQTPPKPKPQNPPKPKAPISNPHKPSTQQPAVVPPPNVPPPTPDPDHFCLTCFNGESSIHWKEGVGEMVSWLTKNPNYNLNIKADGNSTVLRRGWNGGTGMFGGGPTYGERAQSQFGRLQAALKAAGVDPNRIKLTLGNSTGGSLNYSAEKRTP